MKKYISLLIAAVMAICCLAGCSQKNSDISTENTTELKVVTTIFP